MERAVHARSILTFAILTLVPFGLQAAADDIAAPPDFCEGDITAEQVENILADEDDKRSVYERVFALVRISFDAAFLKVRRSEDFEDLVEGVVRQLQRRTLSSADVAKKLTASVKVACQSLENGDGDPEVIEATYLAAGLPPPASRASFSSGGENGGSTYVFFLGNVNSLEADGGWKASLEASFVSVTPFFGPPLRGIEERQSEESQGFSEAMHSLFSGSPRMFGRFELTFSEIGEIEESDTEEEPAPDPEPPPAEVSSGVNPFQVGGGILRVNLGSDLLFGRDGWIGLTGGFGFTTHPSHAANANVDARNRWYAGLLFLANYGSSENNRNHVTGRLVLGYAKDKFWKWTDTTEADDGTITTTPRNESSRFYLDTRIDGPGIFNSENVKLSFRLFADHPTSGNGPTDVRISLLVTTDLGGLMGD